MNNEPVAWMVDGVLFTSLGAALNISFDIEQPCIPLYTHPAKTLTAQEVMEQTHKNISEAHWKAKTLTDEEIIKEINSLATGWFSDKFEKGLFITEEAMVNLIQSVLRKAQEK